MIRVRLPFVAFIAWLLLLFNMERLHEPINIAPFTYLLAAVCGLAVLLVPPLIRMHSVHLVLASLALFLATKYALGYAIAGSALPVTLTECVALGVTMLLARWVGVAFDELRTAVFCNLVSDLKNRSQPFDSGQGELYREVRRARLFKRPLAFMAVAPAPGTTEAAKDRFTAEVMRRMLHRYVTARLADLLSRRLKDCDVIAQRNCHFIAALPETSRNMALATARKIQAEARQELGIELRFGLCTCPDEEATFVGLLQRAEEDMHRPSQCPAAEDEPVETQRKSAAHAASNGSAVVGKEGNPLLASTSAAT